MRKRIQASIQSSNQIKIVVRYFSRIAVLVTAMLLFANPGFAVLGDYDGDCNVDQDDLLILLADRNKTIADSSCG